MARAIRFFEALGADVTPPYPYDDPKTGRIVGIDGAQNIVCLATLKGACLPGPLSAIRLSEKSERTTAVNPAGPAKRPSRVVRHCYTLRPSGAVVDIVIRFYPGLGSCRAAS